MNLPALSAEHHSLIHLVQVFIDPTVRQRVTSLLRHAINVSTHEGGDQDIIVPAVLFYYMESTVVITNLLESTELYTKEKVCTIIDIIHDNKTPGSKPSSLESYIVHDALILSGIQELYTQTAKSLTHTGNGLLHLITQELRSKLISR